MHEDLPPEVMVKCDFCGENYVFSKGKKHHDFPGPVFCDVCLQMLVANEMEAVEPGVKKATAEDVTGPPGGRNLPLQFLSACLQFALLNAPTILLLAPVFFPTKFFSPFTLGATAFGYTVFIDHYLLKTFKGSRTVKYVSLGINLIITVVMMIFIVRFLTIMLIFPRRL